MYSNLEVEAEAPRGVRRAGTRKFQCSLRRIYLLHATLQATMLPSLYSGGSGPSAWALLLEVVVVIDTSSGRCSPRAGTTVYLILLGCRVLGNAVSWTALVIKIGTWLLVPPDKPKTREKTVIPSAGHDIWTAIHHDLAMKK